MITRKEAIKILSSIPVTGLMAGGLLKSFGSSNGENLGEEKDDLLVGGGKNIYESLGVRPLINARGTITVLGATRELPEVKQAMKEATEHYVEFGELMNGVSKRLAELNGAEAGMVTTGASGAITLATAACVTGGDPDKMWKVPDLSGMKNKVIIPSHSVTAYAAAMQAVGTEVVIVSDYKELKSAIGPRTAMIYLLGSTRERKDSLSMKKISSIAKSHDVPILVDAAAQGLYNPNPYLEAGADLVDYSGGKYLQGPQCSGLLLGRKDLIQAAWACSAPHHGPFRGYKVGREEILGALTAAEMWFKRDRNAEIHHSTQMLERIAHRLEPIQSVQTIIRQPHRRTNPSPGLSVKWDKKRIPLSGYDVERLLWDNTPRIAVSGAGSFLPAFPNENPRIGINTSQMLDSEVKVVADRVFSILSNPTHSMKQSRRRISSGEDKGMKFAFWPPIQMDSDSSPAFDVTGEWDLLMKFSASKVDERLVFDQEGAKLTGTHYASYTSRHLFGEIHGRDILFRSAVPGEYPRLNFTFTGKVNKNMMKGKLNMGEYGMAEWKAERHNYSK